MHPALRALCTDTVDHAVYVSQDAYGMPTFAAAVPRPARVEFRVRRVVDHTGQERVSRARVFLHGDVVVDLKDRITLPDGTVPPILTMSSPRDLAGRIDHWAVSF